MFQNTVTIGKSKKYNFTFRKFVLLGQFSKFQLLKKFKDVVNLI